MIPLSPSPTATPTPHLLLGPASCERREGQPAVQPSGSIAPARALGLCVGGLATLRAMPSCTRRQTSAPLSLAADGPAAPSEDPQARRPRGKRRAKAADAGSGAPTADTPAPSDTKGDVTGTAKTRCLGQHRVMPRRPRGSTAPTQLGRAPSGSIAAADSDELAEMLVSEVMGAAVKKVCWFEQSKPGSERPHYIFQMSAVQTAPVHPENG